MPTRISGEIPLSWFGKTLWKYLPFYVELIFLAICLRLIGLVEPFIFQVIIDRILPFQRDASLVVVVVVFLGASLFQLSFDTLSGILGMITANRVTRELGARIHSHLLKLPFGRLRQWTVGETIARISETDTIRSFLVGTTTGVFLDLLFVFVYLGVLFALSPELSLIVLCALPVQFVIYVGFGPLLRWRLRDEFDADAAHQTQMVESLSGIASIKALSAENEIVKRLNRVLTANLAAKYRVNLLHLWNDNLLFAIDRVVTISIIFVGSQMVFASELTLGQLVAFHLLAGRVSGPIKNFSSLWETWQNVRISRQRLGDIINEPIEPFGCAPNLSGEICGALAFHDVCFAHRPEKPILKDLVFQAKPNTLTLITGASGTGKSTFGRLAAGIERPDSGTITLDGHDIAQHDPHDVRLRVAYVPQEPFLFSGSVADNLTCSGQDFDPQLAMRVLRIAAAEDLIDQLNDGFDTLVGERGMALSGGQRQRIAIARSLLCQPKVIVLDEPTSALDIQTQKKMALHLQELKESSTLIVITHSPALFEQPDQTIEFRSAL